MIVQRPQFDMNIVAPNTPYWMIKLSYNRRIDVSTPCIVQSVTPLAINVVYLSDRNEISTMKISINDIIDKTIELTPLVKQKEETK